jgi:hypothetical protein
MSRIKKIIYLHLGFHKTGTTSIQFSGKEYKNLLEEQGFCYPILLGLNGEEYCNHSIPIYSLFCKTPEEYCNHSIPIYSLFCKTPEKYGHNINRGNTTKFIEHIKIQLDKILFRYDKILFRYDKILFRYDKIIISGEDIGNLSLDELLNMKKYFLKYVDEIIPIVYVRRPYNYLCSVISESVKQGNQLSNFYSKIENIKKKKFVKIQHLYLLTI